MKRFFPIAGCLRRGYGRALAGLLLALLPLLAQAAPPVLRFEATGTSGDGTAFVD